MDNLASYIDHTLLKPDCTELQVKTLCNEAREFQFATVCVLPCHVALCADELNGSGVGVCTVVGFPLGANVTKIKVAEAIAAIDDGATEVDMVVNISSVKSGNFNAVFADIYEVCTAVHARGALLKVIIETCLLTSNEKIKLAQIVSQCSADYIKTSTGFSTGGASMEDVALLRANVDESVKVKASGGVRDYASAVDMINAGASRLGTSSGVAILKGAIPSLDSEDY